MRRVRGCWGGVICLLTGWACSESNSSTGESESPNGGMAGVAYGSGSDRSGDNTAGTAGLGQQIDTSIGVAVPINGTAGAPAACVSSSQSAKLRPVYLAFVFDESGSMGMLDFPWEDPVLKWYPVVAATRAFFESQSSVGIFASLTLFPNGDDSCDSDTYARFDVPMTALPSTEMGQVLASIGIPVGEGTPTLPAIQGTVEQLLPMAASNANAKHAIVLVTDGLPAGCTNNTKAAVADAVRAVAASLPTYVIGVKNPPIEGAPDSVSGLNAIAEAGGTTNPFIIETGNPDLTTTAFADAIKLIRGASISCNVDMPAPPQGRELNPRRVKVIYSSGAVETPLSYDPVCLGQVAWYYDNPTHPSEIRLCPASCDSIRADMNARLSVEFACEDVILNI